MKACANKERRQFVEDIFAVADLETLLKRCIDPLLSRFRVFPYHILHFEFEGVEEAVEHPTGVKVTWSKYASKRYFELEYDPDPENLIHMKAVAQERKVFPEAPGFLNILHSFPTTGIRPMELVPGSYALLQHVHAKVSNRWERKPSVLAAWDRFLEVAPRSDDVDEYCQIYPLKVPLREFLFGDLPVEGARRQYAEPRSLAVSSRTLTDTLIHTGMIVNGHIVGFGTSKHS